MAGERPEARGALSREELFVRGRTLALVVTVGSMALLALLLALPLTMEHTFEGAQLLLWAGLLLIAALIVGISLVYAYLARAVGSPEGEGAAPEKSGPEAPLTDRALNLLQEDERAVYRRLLHEGGQVLQKDLRRMVAFSGPKMTRVLDRLERKGLVVRERHGMTNRVRLQESEG